MNARSAALLLTALGGVTLAAAVLAGEPAAAPAPSAPKADVQIAPLPAPAAPPRAPAPVAGPLLKATLITHAAGGKQPTTCAIVKDGAKLLVTNRGDNSVSVFDTATMTIERTIPEVGYSAWGVVRRPTGQLLVANWAGSTIALIDEATGKRTGQVSVGMKPSYLAVSPDGTKVYSSGNFSDDVTIADLGTKRAARQIPVGHKPMGVAVSPDGRWLWVAVCDSKKIAKVDLKHEVQLDQFGAPLATTTNLVLTPDGRKLLAAGDGGRLLIMDVETEEVEKIVVGLDSSCVAVTPDGRVALVADYNGAEVSLVDLPARQKYASVATGTGTMHVETDGKRFYTCNDKAGTVSAFRLDPIDSAAGAGK